MINYRVLTMINVTNKNCRSLRLPDHQFELLSPLNDYLANLAHRGYRLLLDFHNEDLM